MWKDMGLTKSKVRTLNFQRVKFQLFKNLVDEIPRTLTLGTKELKRAGDSLMMLFLEHKNSPSPCVRNQAGRIGNWDG